MTDAAGLVDAMRLFLARHEEALSTGEPARGMEACEGIVEALGVTLPAELATVEDVTERHRVARAVLERRMAELEGLALQLKLAFHQLEEREVDVLRLVALLTATRRQIRALQQTLALWAHEHGAPPAREEGASEALRAAREALTAGCPEAAGAALADAARRAGVAAPAPTSGLVEAWHALDATAAAIERQVRGLDQA